MMHAREIVPLSPPVRTTHTPHPLQFVAHLVAALATVGAWFVFGESATATVVTGVVAFFLSSGVRVADQWEKAVVLRAGHFRKSFAHGPFWVLPFMDQIAQWVDHRVQTTSFSAQQTLTKDTVPVDVDAVLFWHVWDAEKATLEVNEYQRAIFYKAQTNLRDVIGESMLAGLLVGRKELGQRLQEMIDRETTPWGITVGSVEIRDIVIPQELQDAMSRQAQAERERQARVILGDAERQIAQSFVDAGRQYEQNPTAMHLRAMNMLYEGLKEKGALIVVPSTAVESMGLGGMLGTTALTGVVKREE
jgi:regulator of protease activity HflC (stomatin/prohibitin superfamily)